MVKIEEDNNLQNLTFGYQIAQKKMESQTSANQSIDSKVGILLGFTGAISVGVIALVAGTIKLVGINVFTLGVALLVIAIYSLIVASQSQTFHDPPDFDTFYSESALAKTHQDLLNQVISDTKQCYLLNANVINSKAKHFDRAVFSLGISLALLFIGLFK